MTAARRQPVEQLQRVFGTMVLAGMLCLPAARAFADGTGTCPGDCNSDRAVTVDELLVMVNVALDNAPASACPSGDRNADGAITIDEILLAVGSALGTCPGEPTVTPTPETPTVLYRNDPQAVGNPFPSDRLLDAYGHVQMPVSLLDPGLPATAAYQQTREYLNDLADQLHAFTAFGTYAPIRIPVGAPVTIAPSDNPPGIMLLNFNDLGAAPPPIRVTFYQPDSSIEVQPLRPLQPRTTYAIVVTTALQDTHGNAMQPSADFTALLEDTAPELQPLRTRLEPLIAYLDNHGIGKDSLALLDLFTTQATTDDLLAIRDRLDSAGLVPGTPVFSNAPVPGLTSGIFPEGSAQFKTLVGTATSPNIAAVAVGSFDAYDFRSRTDGPFDPSLISGPAVPGVNHVDFYMTIPKAPAPPNGYPIVIFGHGLYGSNRDVITNVPQTIG